MWAVCTVADMQGGRWEPDAFFRTGVAFVDWLGSWFGLHRLPVPKGRALDFGCGVGRLAQALAPHFDHVTGVDVAASMVERARRFDRSRGNVEYVVNVRPDLACFADRSFDFVLTASVLQHMRPDYQLGYLREFVRVLRPGGCAFFQLPTAVVRDGGPKPAAADGGPGEMHMEMHCVPAEQVRAAVAAAGGRIRLEEPDQWAGPFWDSRHFLVDAGGPAG